MRTQATKSICHLLSIALVAMLLPSVLGTLGGLGADVGAPAQAKSPRRIPYISEATFRRLSDVQELIDAEEYAEAIEMLTPLVLRVRRYNGNELAQMHNLLGYSYFEMDNLDKTIHHFEQVLAQMPNISEGMELTTLDRVSSLYFQAGSQRDGEAAAPWYRKALAAWEDWLSKSDNPGPDAYFYMAQIYYQMQDYTNAIDRLELVIELARQRNIKAREQWWQMLQVLYFYQENWPKVAEVLEILVKDYPKRAYWVNLASVYAEMGSPEKQIWTMEAAHVAGYLTQEGDIRTYGGLLMQSEIPNRASKFLQQGVDDKTVKRTTKNLQMLGQAYQLARDVDKAIPVFESAAKLSEDGETYDSLSMLYLDKDRHAACENAAQKALDKGGLRNALHTQITLASCQFYLDKLTAALEMFNAVQREARQDKKRTEQKIAAQWIGYITNERKRRAELERAGG